MRIEGDSVKAKKTNESGYISEEDKKSEDGVESITTTTAAVINAQFDDKCTNDEDDTKKAKNHN